LLELIQIRGYYTNKKKCNSFRLSLEPILKLLINNVAQQEDSNKSFAGA
jgi:hypothetical protein